MGVAAATPSALREQAAELLPHSSDLTTALNDHLFALMPELRERDDGTLREETWASCEANVLQILRLLMSGAGPEAITMPADAAKWAHSLVRRGITLATLLRAYRLGHAWFWDRWSQLLHDRLPDAEAFIEAQERSSAFLFAYIDHMSAVLVEEYGSERERVVRGAEQLRAETVRALLSGEAIDEEVAVGRLGYELRRHHVALRVSGRGSELRGLERAALEAAAVLGPGEPLVVPTGAATVDVWCAAFEPLELEPLDAYTPPEGILVAAGTPGHGLDGFRSSHGEAVQAARLATLARDAAMPVTRYEQVELASLLAADLPRARTFVARRLGPLASPAEPVSRLRETVLAFLVAGGSATRVAKQLFVHQNTVAYRVKRAEELLGRGVTDDPVELTCALTLVAALGAAVLPGDGEEPAVSE
jgi:DNA-binding PucR family transcriptional regulator